ncbi:urease accessory protein UreE [Gracilibacillus alcaliphilus]|uniref:urease accessory protein UreE n=1 Tax=Gracilibacillus alcaliphilus TaxID=1401441 RepID=UPI00195644A3|nr:urease accessory protein UreE [Gracilibacillus alcaliphilus]MBM7677500.1 urease accessory protein [Gracilibacillus alcaliphilus]
MKLTNVIGNIESADYYAETVEWIELDWEELNKRILRKFTTKGREIAIILEEQGLQYGDILYQDETSTMAIRTKSEPAYVIRPASITEMGKIAFELGNRHTPCIIEGNEIIVRYDRTLEDIFAKTGVAYVQTEKRFKQPFKYKGHHHHDEHAAAASTHAHS